MTELLPAEPDKDGSYWVTSREDDPEYDRVFEWFADARAWRDDWRHDDDQLISPEQAYASGFRLSWPHPIPTSGQLKAMQPLTERQPIATAPKDGTAVDLWEQYTDNGKLVWMRWPACKWLDGEWKRMDWDIGDYIENPGCTHWTAIVA